MEDNKKILILILCVALVVFSLPVYAEEETTGADAYEDSFTLQDVKEGRHLPEFMDFVGYVGESAEFVYSVYTKDIIGAVLSSMMAYKNPVKEWSDDHSVILQDSLMGDVDFCESIKFLPKVMAVEWDKSTSDAVQKNEPCVGRFLTSIYTNVAPGFFPCSVVYYYNSHFSDDNYYNWFNSSTPDMFFTNVGGSVLFCSKSSANNHSLSVDVRRTTNVEPKSDTDGYVRYSGINLGTSIFIDGVTYYYTHRGLGAWDNHYNFNDRFAQTYSDAQTACQAFYTHEPKQQTVPNGEGYIRPIPEGKKIRATSKNIFNTDFSIYIQNNYNTYGADFVNVPIDDYPYTKPNPETPSWWFDIYRDPVAIPNDDNYTDLTNLDLGTPATNDTSFLSACFAVIPERIAVMFVSLSVLWAVCCLFKKGD